MITVIKLNALGEAKVQYQGEIIQRLTDRVVIQAYWAQATKDLGYTQFEPGDRFIEYYYTDRWFNIFDIATADGMRKGWYCNIAEPAVFFADRIEQVDLLLDVWVDPTGNPLILDEDEFASDTTLTAQQRDGAQHGLQELLQMIAAQEEPFTLNHSRA
jgi:uncharacterized protein